MQLYAWENVTESCHHESFETYINAVIVNLLTPNVNYSARTAPLTSKVAFYIFIQQI